MEPLTDKQKIALERAAVRCRERNILIPTYEQLAHPEKIPEKVKEELKGIGLWDLNSRNLFRITWKNEPVAHGGGYGKVNYIEIPSQLSGVKARIFILIGKHFPTGSHKVGASFGPLVDRLVRGQFDPTAQKALYPSTGNYCRGGAFNSYLLACHNVAVLPANMSRERFEWLKKVGSEVFATPGCESNVKEVFDKTNELVRERGEGIVALNQFSEFPNPLFHYWVTGQAMEEVFNMENKDGKLRMAGVHLTQGSGGTLASGYYMKERFPHAKLSAGEALQCPTLLYNGNGDHRIEGIGDKHVPWVIDIKNLDMVVDIDDENCMRVLRLFNDPVGKAYLKKVGVSEKVVEELGLLGISSIGNLIGCIKQAKYYELTEQDCLFTIATDSVEMYHSRVDEMKALKPGYNEIDAAIDMESGLTGVRIDHMLEMSYYDRKRMHGLKYFTWVEQQGMTKLELDSQWDDPEYFLKKWAHVKELDVAIQEFNRKTGLAQKYE
jgi:cysteine synthase